MGGPRIHSYFRFRRRQSLSAFRSKAEAAALPEGKSDAPFQAAIASLAPLTSAGGLRARGKAGALPLFSLFSAPTSADVCGSLVVGVS